MAAARCNSGIAAIWESDDPDKGFKKGDLKFTLHGDKLHGSWVLVRMRHDRSGGKRTNWLLIKHRDEYAREGEANDILEEDRSVASGRSHGPDCRRQGQGAEAVHDEGSRPRPSRCGLAFEPRGSGGSARDTPGSAACTCEGGKGRRNARVRRVCSCARRSSSRPTGQAGATRSNSTAIVSSCGSRMARPRCERVKAWTGRTSSRRLRKRALHCRMR